MDEGWIKTYRSLLKSPVFLCLNGDHFKVAMVCLLKANHKPQKWLYGGKLFTCEAGQFITSLNHLAKACGEGGSVQKTRTALKRLEELEFLTSTSTKSGRLITIVNWGIYQGDDGDANKPTNKDLTKSQQSPNKDLTTNKNVKNVKNEKNLSMTDDTDDDDDAYMGLNEFYSETADRQRREAWKKRRASHE